MKTYNYSQEGTIFGPITIEQLKSLAASGQLSRDATVWLTGAGKGSRAEHISGLFPPPAPPTQAPPPLPPIDDACSSAKGVTDITGIVTTAIKSQLTKAYSPKVHGFTRMIQRIAWTACGSVVLYKGFFFWRAVVSAHRRGELLTGFYSAEVLVWFVGSYILARVVEKFTNPGLAMTQDHQH